MILDVSKQQELEGIGGRDFYRELIDKFIVQSREIIGELEDAVSDGDIVQASRALHRIKGSCGVVGAGTLLDVVAHAYEESKTSLISSDTIASIRSLMDEVAAERAKL